MKTLIRLVKPFITHVVRLNKLLVIIASVERGYPILCTNMEIVS
jgi:hypothetical protein